MSLFEIILIGIGLSMDAACVSMSDGMCYKAKLKNVLSIGLAFGLFQGIMPIIGYYGGSIFSEQISQYDHWLALILLGIIGGKMVYEAVWGKEPESNSCEATLTFKLLLVQAVATSIDALALGVSFAAMNVNIYLAALVIAVTTFVLSIISVYIGNKVGTRLNQKAEIFGGVILILLGIKIFVEHMFF